MAIESYYDSVKGIFLKDGSVEVKYIDSERGKVLFPLELLLIRVTLTALHRAFLLIKTIALGKVSLLRCLLVRYADSAVLISKLRRLHLYCTRWCMMNMNKRNLMKKYAFFFDFTFEEC